jgi:hypothetical protein
MSRGRLCGLISAGRSSDAARCAASDPPWAALPLLQQLKQIGTKNAKRHKAKTYKAFLKEAFFASPSSSS